MIFVVRCFAYIIQTLITEVSVRAKSVSASLMLYQNKARLWATSVWQGSGDSEGSSHRLLVIHSCTEPTNRQLEHKNLILHHVQIVMLQYQLRSLAEGSHWKTRLFAVTKRKTKSNTYCSYFSQDKWCVLS